MVDKDDLIPNNLRSSTKAFDANWGPRSDIILSGSPKCLYKFSNYSCAVPSAMIVFKHGIRIIPSLILDQLLRGWSHVPLLEVGL